MRVSLIPLPSLPIPSAPEVPARMTSLDQVSAYVDQLGKWAKEVARWHERAHAVMRQNTDRISQAVFVDGPSGGPKETRIGVSPTSAEIASHLKGTATPDESNRVLAFRTLA